LHETGFIPSRFHGRLAVAHLVPLFAAGDRPQNPPRLFETHAGQATRLGVIIADHGRFKEMKS
jgi:hypothetical protein